MKDGGPAFPRTAYQFPNGGPEEEWHDSQEGMSLRDYFAAKAMQGALANPNTKLDNEDDVATFVSVVSEMSYKFADAMLKEREK